MAETSDAEARLECGICDKRFSRRSFLRRHIRRTHTDNPTKYNCQYCGRSFTLKSNMLRHENVIHKKVLQHSCDASGECSERFGSKQQLMAHKRKMHRSLKLRCPKCDSKFTYTNNLKEHQKICSTQIKTHACGQCNKKFKAERYLKAHQRFFHNKSGSCVCEVCGDSFYTKGSLKRHTKRKHQ